jgi:hypothetical protein
VVVSGAVVPGAVVSGDVVAGAVVSGAVVPGAVFVPPGAGAEVEPGVVVPGVALGVGAAVSGVGAAVPGVGAAVPGVGDTVEAPEFGVMLGFELDEGGVVLGVVVVPGFCGVPWLAPGFADRGAAVPDCPPAARVEPAAVPPPPPPACISSGVTVAISTGTTSEAVGPGPGVVVLAPLQVSATFVALAT